MMRASQGYIPSKGGEVMAGRGRPITNKTLLGRQINKSGLKSYQISAQANICNRLMTEYIQARRIMTSEHVEALCRVLSCKPEDIIEPGLTENLTHITGVPIGDEIRSVKELDMSHLNIHPAAHQPTVAPPSIIRRVS